MAMKSVFKVMMRKFCHMILLVLTAMSIAMTGCISDEVSTSPGDVLAFSSDTLKFDTVITSQGTATKQFIIYNRAKKMINISSIKVAVKSDAKFFLNVDGVKGDEFHDVAIRGEDSVYVFVECYIDPTNADEPVAVDDRIDFVTNGVQQSVTLTAWAQDVERIVGDTIRGDARMAGVKPYLIYDTLVVAEGATLTIDPGVKLLFHDKAALKVDGTLKANGSVDKNIEMRGDRLDHVVGKIGYDIMSAQWGGVIFGENSFGNELNYVNMRGSTDGVTVTSSNPERCSLTVFNSVLHNAKNTVLASHNAWVEAFGTEFSDAGKNVVKLEGGKVRFAQCTMANYYLFAAIEGTIADFAVQDSVGAYAPLDCQLDNCVLYGNCADVNMGDLTGTSIYLRNCLLKSNGSDDSNFLNCKWGGDPKFYTVREDYIFDYRLKNGSDAIAVGDRQLCPEKARYDRYGKDRFAADGIDLGAYVWVEADEDAEGGAK